MNTTTRVLSWLAADASVPRWAICLAVLAVVILTSEVAACVVVWLEQRKFDRENGR